VARNGNPDDPDNYPESDPTQYADYGGSGGQAYSEVGPAQPPVYGQPTGYDPAAKGYAPQTGYGPYPGAEAGPAWHHRPAVLIGLGALTAALLALLIYAIVSFTNAGPSTTPAVTSTGSAAPTSSAPTDSQPPQIQDTVTRFEAPSASTSAAPPPAPEPTTVTSTVTPTTTAAPTTTEAPSPTTVTSVTTSVTTVTQTTTKPLWPTIPRPTPRTAAPEPAPAG
jgi:hypothetical protein